VLALAAERAVKQLLAGGGLFRHLLPALPALMGFHGL
jgi:hypothetical protein